MITTITPEAAANLLRTMGCDRVTETELFGVDVYINCEAPFNQVTLQGDFTEMRLAAVLTWMSDRKAVADAWAAA